MTTRTKFFLVVLLSILMCACASELRAPCDAHAHFCGSKTKITQWQ